MPYIPLEQRAMFNVHLQGLEVVGFETKGQLEYCIYCLMKAYMKGKTNNYSNLHDCVYAAQHCADEFRRRNLDAREDYAREQNGDIW